MELDTKGLRTLNGWLMQVPRNRKERLKKNPVVSNEQLNEISGGLGDEAAKEFGEGLGKAFG